MSEGRDQAVGVLREIRRTRRQHFVEQLDLMELLYRVYLAVIFGGIALAYVGSVIDEATASPAAVDAIRDHGPAVLGTAIAIAVLAGLRTGSRGGPLAIEPAEVQYVLLAPVDRGAALRPAALKQLRVAAGAGAALGAVVASFALRRLPGSPVEWIACLALFGALVPTAFLAAAMLASGRRFRPLLAGTAGLLGLAWSLLDLLAGTTTSPATFVGELGTLPLQDGTAAALSAIGLVATLALLVAGLLGVGGLLLEAARRRAKLAAELRFSASVQDLRTVVLLRRQLAAERPRRRPWLRLGLGGSARHPVWRRGWQSFLRWPLARAARVMVLAILAGAAAVGAWEISIVLAVVPGALLFVAALDLVEPLAQEADHPTRTGLLPVPAASLIKSHLFAPATAAIVVVAIAALAAAAISRDPVALQLGALMALPAGFALAVCAAISATNDPYEFILAPGIAYAQSFGPVLAAVVICGLPIVIGHAVWVRDAAPAGPVSSIAIVVALVAVGASQFLGSRMTGRRAVSS